MSTCIVYTVPFTTVVVIGYVQTMFSVSEGVGSVQLDVRLMDTASLDQIPNLEVFLSAETNDGTASMLRLNHSSYFHGPAIHRSCCMQSE